MKQSDQINELAAALSKAQGEFEDAKKDTKGYGYNYADLAQILQIARPVLASNNLSLIQMPTNLDGGMAVTTRLAHASGQWIEETLSLPFEKPKGMSIEQGAGKTITYLRRYCAAAILGISQEDNDGSNAGRETVPVAMPANFDEGKAKLEAAAKNGVEALKAAFFELSKAEQKGLVKVKDGLKEIAVQADLENINGAA